MQREDARTVTFVFGLDPNEVDLEERYFWSDGALAEARALIRANPAVAHLHWLNLRTYKYAIPNLGIERTPPPRVRAAERLYSAGFYDFAQYVFRSIEMCLGAEAWQQPRFDELTKLVGLGFKVIAFDEFGEWNCHQPRDRRGRSRGSRPRLRFQLLSMRSHALRPHPLPQSSSTSRHVHRGERARASSTSSCEIVRRYSLDGINGSGHPFRVLAPHDPASVAR